jgi:hypothetical protein
LKNQTSYRGKLLMQGLLMRVLLYFNCEHNNYSMAPAHTYNNCQPLNTESQAVSLKQISKHLFWQILSDLWFGHQSG